MPFGSAFLVNNIGISQEQIPWVFMFTGLSSVIVMPIIGRLSDRVDKFKLFTFGSLWALVMVIVYTNISVMPLPDMKDRGAFMSINTSLQYMAGGISAIIAGQIVHQETKLSPIEHYDTLGYVVAFVILICIYFMYRVSKVVKNKAEQKT
jgi:predicted MFS family arabinose efflux permease